MGRTTARTDVTRSAVLAHIGVHGPTSRAELARVLDVSPALITGATKRLIADGLLTELDHSPSQGGRPARLLGLVAESGRAIGIKVVADHITLVEVGIDGTVQRSATRDFDAAAPAALSELAAVTVAFIDAGTSGPLLGVGVGVPGTVDEQHAGTVDSTQLGWVRVPVGETLRRALDLPVLVENNVNALAMAEALYGSGRGLGHALVVTIGTGVGAGLITDGDVLRGWRGGAGELGHVPVVADGPACVCGSTGCLETLISEEALLRAATAQGIVPEAASIDAVHTAADTGDAGAQAIFRTAGTHLGRTLAGVVNLLDPEAVIVLGEGVTAWTHWSAGFEPAFRAALIPHTRHIPVTVETWQDDRWAQGSAALVLSTPFDAQGLSGEQGRLVRERLAIGEVAASAASPAGPAGNGG
ncbi:ROK family transcriptional regulator [Ruania alba]|uniref:Sugar kinase of the NBD/HSP70 family, may contain an N-terminal HTH domain n=1 Tax=Ruania alba TaxID=648782 RepID=A0A1H5D4P5_9MICO|nr:ROK family transcriptional regulator [Ruania alba]SED73784.1 Sugar kinase of the NBD/HSP70 family, may contain an N-terminal HTH domain [Ruania alba]